MTCCVVVATERGAVCVCVCVCVCASVRARACMWLRDTQTAHKTRSHLNTFGARQLITQFHTGGPVGVRWLQKNLVFRVLCTFGAVDFRSGVQNSAKSQIVSRGVRVFVSFLGMLLFLSRRTDVQRTLKHTRVGTLIVATIYLQLMQNRYMFRSFTVLQCSHQHCVQPVASDVEVVGYL